ncbi:acyl-CoA dehydrogenase family protein [Brenneria tiliae]|uniref:Acyl-CoA dehydrogenase C-terminal domain-containing protein n=1 Tax=Brenneria tiliae TaxID=2914984 RepID=A0ABT0MWY8_9GAMM|nr:acyl-CoA dehydrogenase family protein [Brenneria tiliae]MCL2894353.1 hypothetical protein [Brenneria tiliae]
MSDQSGTSAPAIASFQSVPSSDITAKAHALRRELAALATASDLKSEYRQAREKLRRSGLLSLRVPREEGGESASQTQVIEVCRILAHADPGIAQLLQPHYGFTDAIRLLPSAQARRVLYRDVLNGERIANAASERGGRHSADFATTIIRQGDHYRLDGRKYYATGSIGARWITVIGRGEDGEAALAWIRTDTPGLTLLDDWNGIGQRGSSSGTLILAGAAVHADYVIPQWDEAHRGIAWHESGRLIHAAIDLGIAEGALEWGTHSVATDNRIPFESPYPSLAEDPLLQYQIGVLSARVKAVTALLADTARLLDEVQQRDGEQLPALQSALAAAKALAAEISLTVSSEVFSWSGARAADRALRIDRYWRNARTHTLHDPVRLRYQELGRSQLALFARTSSNQEPH